MGTAGCRTDIWSSCSGRGCEVYFLVIIYFHFETLNFWSKMRESSNHLLERRIWNQFRLSTLFSCVPSCPIIPLISDHDLARHASHHHPHTPRAHSYCGDDWCDGRALFSPRTMGAAFMREARLVALLFGRLTAAGIVVVVRDARATKQRPGYVCVCRCEGNQTRAEYFRSSCIFHRIHKTLCRVNF